MKNTNGNTGKAGEAAAAEYLKEKGYLIHTLNYRSRYGEIDIIAEKDGELVFVEVKTRKSADFGSPCEYVTPAKMQRITATAEYYEYVNETGLAPRFDVVEIITGKAGDLSDITINHIENAFESR